MNDNVLFMLDVAEGPLFRFAFALMLLGLARLALLMLSDFLGAYMTTDDRGAFRDKLRQRLLWFFFPTAILRRLHIGGGAGMLTYHTGLFLVSLVFRLCAIIVPAFMVAHVYLWERGLGIGWPHLPVSVGDVLSIVTIIAGVVLFFSRLYSPALRQIEPGWVFLKPLILILPFITGVLAMHPGWCPVDYHVMMLLHVISALVVMAMIPFAKMFAGIHAPLADVDPEMAWQPSREEGTPVPAPTN